MNAITNSLNAIWSSSVGKKIIVAVTGAFLLLFLAGHLAGNLLIYAGRDAFNTYAALLHDMIHGVGIWLFRVVMVVMVGGHIAATVALTMQNRAARQAYECETVIQASTASRTMIISGLAILAFIIYHILHFTVRVGYDIKVDQAHFTKTGVERPDAWQMVVDGFQSPLVALVYIAAMSLLAMHLSHGFASVFQTLGIRPRKSAATIQQLSMLYSAVIWAGFVSIPIAIFFGIVK
ncbi:MAG: succinate dehydrogenase cytochrome b subunit [Akkermansiaceae bacterium]|jgi:succinate dehydrogenase / fumarate reductase cytochrome b subunit|nr:succinate dehydrogenase cytochrome b subunit [Akkermansiaceae bacterium]